MGLACGQVRTSAASHCVCLGDITGPGMEHCCNVGKEMPGSDDWPETFRSALFKYLVLKKWKMRDAEIATTVYFY